MPPRFHETWKADSKTNRAEIHETALLQSRAIQDLRERVAVLENVDNPRPIPLKPFYGFPTGLESVDIHGDEPNSYDLSDDGATRKFATLVHWSDGADQAVMGRCSFAHVKQAAGGGKEKITEEGGRYSGPAAGAYTPAGIECPRVQWTFQNSQDAGGTGTDSQLIRIVTALPQNFRSWRSRGIRMAVRIYGNGFDAGGADAFTAQLKVAKPDDLEGSDLAVSSLIGEEATAASTTYDTGWEVLQISGDSLGKNWGPRYPLVLELAAVTPEHHNDLWLFVSFLEFDWR